MRVQVERVAVPPRAGSRKPKCPAGARRFHHLLGRGQPSWAGGPPPAENATRRLPPPVDVPPGDRAREDDGRHPRVDREGDGASPFQLLPPALQPPPGPQAAPPAAGTAGAQAEVAALAERLLTSLRIGRVGHRGHEVRMRLGGALDGVEVRLRHDDAGRVTAELHAEPSARGRAERMARLLSAELRHRGAELDSIELR